MASCELVTRDHVPLRILRSETDDKSVYVFIQQYHSLTAEKRTVKKNSILRGAGALVERHGLAVENVYRLQTERYQLKPSAPAIAGGLESGPAAVW
ncbi:hypothetical protein EVAR_17536_1 [Eumeta japonica]|uniref:Uncharacterized protein n=1 Tax=Eumeta variegata TaxID=151549 RepID=A0A4C1WQ90_EUMVA|nr:hypothetical protein EVAR_17536_1 [Eumeta japonica]